MVGRESGGFRSEVLDRADGAELEEVIECTTLEGTVVNTDKWKGYDGLPERGRVHKTVDHSGPKSTWARDDDGDQGHERGQQTRSECGGDQGAAHHPHQPGHQERVDVAGGLFDDDEWFLLKIERDDHGEDRYRAIRQGRRRKVAALCVPLPHGQDKRDVHEFLHREILDKGQDIAKQVGNSWLIAVCLFTLATNELSVGSPAQEAGLEHGDVIMQVDRKPVHNVREFNQLVSQLGKQPVLLLVNRGGTTLYMVIQAR